MKLKVDATPLVRTNVDGVSRYSIELLKHLTGYEYEFLSFVGDRSPQLPGKMKRLWLPRKVYSLLNKTISLPAIGSDEDVVLFPNFFEFPKSRGHKIVVVHDLAYLNQPETVEPRNVRALTKLVPRAIARADKVIAISQTVQKQLIVTYNIDPAKTAVVGIGVDTNYFKPATASQIATARSSYGLPEKYILFLGTIEPRKNISAAIEAYALLPEEIRRTYGLVLAGRLGWEKQSTLNRIDELKARGNNIIMPGYIGDDSPAVISGASVFILPSLDEGFGIPLIEAMACGVPTIASDIAILKEVSAGASLLVDPKNPSAISDAIKKVLTESKTTTELKTAGRARAQQFSWQASAAQLDEAIKSVSG